MQILSQIRHRHLTRFIILLVLVLLPILVAIISKNLLVSLLSPFLLIAIIFIITQLKGSLPVLNIANIALPLEMFFSKLSSSEDAYDGIKIRNLIHLKGELQRQKHLLTEIKISQDILNKISSDIEVNKVISVLNEQVSRIYYLQNSLEQSNHKPIEAFKNLINLNITLKLTIQHFSIYFIVINDLEKATNYPENIILIKKELDLLKNKLVSDKYLLDNISKSIEGASNE